MSVMPETSRTDGSRVGPQHEAGRAGGRGARPYAWTRPRRALFLADLIVLIALQLHVWSGWAHGWRADIVGDAAGRWSHNLVAGLGACVALFILAWDGQYSGRRRLSRVDDTIEACKALFIAATVVLFAAFVTKGFGTDFTNYSRGVLALDAGALLIMLVAARWIVWVWQTRLFRGRVGLRRLLVAGCGAAASRFETFLHSRPWLGYECAGSVAVLEFAPASDLVGGTYLPLRVIGTAQQLPQLMAATGAEEVVVALDADEAVVLPELQRFLHAQAIPFRLMPDLFELGYGHAAELGIDGLDIISLDVGAMHRAQRLAKRAADIVFSAAVLVVLSPLLFLIALAVRVETPGRAIYAQQRVGSHGRLFSMYKFRTMYVGSDRRLQMLEDQNEAEGPLFKMRADPRITRVGRFLRRWSLDELPQFFNVLKGEMSVVGPRPPLPSEVEHYSVKDLVRLKGKPGITGLWQVSGRSDLPFEKMVELDQYYLENWSLGLDVSVLLRTVGAVLGRRGAY